MSGIEIVERRRAVEQGLEVPREAAPFAAGQQFQLLRDRFRSFTPDGDRVANLAGAPLRLRRVACQRRQHDRLHPLDAPLRLQFDPPDALDLVTEELDSQRLFRPRREHVEDAAPPGRDAGLFRQRLEPVPRLLQPPLERFRSHRIVPTPTSVPAASTSGPARNSATAAHEATTIAGSPARSWRSARSRSAIAAGSSSVSSYGSRSLAGRRTTGRSPAYSASSSASSDARPGLAASTSVGPARPAAIAAIVTGFAASGAPSETGSRARARAPRCPSTAARTPASWLAMPRSNAIWPER